jgi:hypothetical protein
MAISGKVVKDSATDESSTAPRPSSSPFQAPYITRINISIPIIIGINWPADEISATPLIPFHCIVFSVAMVTAVATAVLNTVWIACRINFRFGLGAILE